jgi:hypothetical protein
MTSPTTFLAGYDPRVSATTLATRTWLLAVLPALIEEVDVSARIIGYGFGPGYKGNVCAIIPSKKGVKLGFNRAVGLPDPTGLLEGTGKVHRYVVIHGENDLRNPALLALLHVAADACHKRLAG